MLQGVEPQVDQPGGLRVTADRDDATHVESSLLLENVEARPTTRGPSTRLATRPPPRLGSATPSRCAGEGINPPTIPSSRRPLSPRQFAGGGGRGVGPKRAGPRTPV